jgi:hypothetical protein
MDRERKRSDRAQTPRALDVSPPVRRALHAIRQRSGTASAPALHFRAVTDVEQSLRCRFHDDVLAVLGSGGRALDDASVRLDLIVDHTAAARDRGAPRDMIAIGRHPDGHVFYLVPKEPCGSIYDWDETDQSLLRRSLHQWLTEWLDGEESDLPEPPRDFTPRLIDAAPSTRRVRHARFGGGRVERVLEGGKLVIVFDDGVTRTLLARFVEDA